MHTTLAEPAAYAKKNLLPLQKRIGLGPVKIAIGGGEPKIGPWERRRLAGQFRCHTPALPGQIYLMTNSCPFVFIHPLHPPQCCYGGRAQCCYGGRVRG